MCGIFGFQVKKGEKLDPYESTIIGFTLADRMAQRGRDSFGGRFWPAEGDLTPTTFKGIGPIMTEGARMLRKFSNTSKAICHTRAATVGGVSIPNCHPFEIGDVIGVHNGGVYNHERLNRELNRSFEVDSMHIFAQIDSGLDIEDLDAYGTVAWTQKSNDSNIFLARSSGGQLSVARLYRDRTAKVEDPNYQVLVFASTSDAISEAARRLEMQYHFVTTDPEKLYKIVDGEVFDTLEPFKLGTKPYFQPSGFTRGHNHNSSGTSLMDEYRERRKLALEQAFGTKEEKKQETKKERKAREKQERRDAEFWELYTADPLPKNLAPSLAGPRYLGTGQTTPIIICPDCGCNCAIHTWGYCKNNQSSKCRKPAGQLCHIKDVKVCRDCSCYLIEPIHQDSLGSLRGVIFCNVCKSYCTPDPLELSDDDLASMEGDADLHIIQFAKNPHASIEEVETDTEDAEEVPDTKPTVIEIGPSRVPMVLDTRNRGPHDVITQAIINAANKDERQRALDNIEADLVTTTQYPRLV